MNLWTEVLLAGLIVLGVYLVCKISLMLFSEWELNASDAVKRSETAIEVYARFESLEYYVRLALAASEGKLPVIVYLKKEDQNARDMEDTLQKIRREHRNLSYRWL